MEGVIGDGFGSEGETQDDRYLYVIMSPLPFRLRLAAYGWQGFAIRRMDVVGCGIFSCS